MTRAKLEKRNSKLVLPIFCFLFSLFAFLPAGAQAPASGERAVVASYYKLAPGKADEWLQRYRAQHLPILKELQREGRIVSITLYRPVLHQGAPEWDYKVVLVWRDFAAWGDRAREEAVERRLFSDWETHRKDELRRWEITARHWDDLMAEVPTD
jgi:hypothetical protein